MRHWLLRTPLAAKENLSTFLDTRHWRSRRLIVQPWACDLLLGQTNVHFSHGVPCGCGARPLSFKLRTLSSAYQPDDSRDPKWFFLPYSTFSFTQPSETHIRSLPVLLGAQPDLFAQPQPLLSTQHFGSEIRISPVLLSPTSNDM